MTIRSFIPNFIKPLIRFLVYEQERRKVFRERKIKALQDTQLKQLDSTASRLILFLIPGADYDTGTETISGGIISIVSLCEESAKLREVHGAEVLLCTFPGQHLLAKHTQFKNESAVFRFDQLPDYFSVAEEVLVHIPEYLVGRFVMLTRNGEFNWLRNLKSVHINILNQNIRLMPLPEELLELKLCSNKRTITTAHQQYCTQYYRDLYKLPLHKFSVWMSPEKYLFKAFEEKSELIVVSPDPHPLKEELLKKISEQAQLKVLIIQNLTYERYKEVIAEARWALTFGEGLDGYFIEPVFSGAIGFGVFNSDFFTSDFKELTTIYPSLEQLSESIIEDIFRLRDEKKFNAYQRKQFDLCAKHYSKEVYERNILEFYQGRYTYA